MCDGIVLYGTFPCNRRNATRQRRRGARVDTARTETVYDMPAPHILVVDNYDSFVFTIVSYLTQLGAECEVVRHDDVDLSTIPTFDGVLVSPGPGTPQSAGLTIPTITTCAEHHTPMFGVCLGHQALGEVYGATVGPAPTIMHGKTSTITHDSLGVFDGLANPLTVTRYHSLAVQPDSIAAPLVVTAATDDGVVMGLRHESLPLAGVQFHPESILSHSGYRLFANWLSSLGFSRALEIAQALPTSWEAADLMDSKTTR